MIKKLSGIYLLLSLCVSLYAQNVADVSLNFYKKELLAFTEENNRAARAYALSLAEGLGTWVHLNIDKANVQDGLLMQTRLYLRAEEYGQALVHLFLLRNLFPNVDITLLTPLLTESSLALNRDYRDLASKLFSKTTSNDNATIEIREAEALYQLSKLQGRNFYEPACHAFESFFERFPNYKANDLVELWYGDLHRVNGNYYAAISQYKKAGELYPKTPYKAASQRLVGDIYADNLKDTASALATYTQVLHEYPESNEVGIVYKHMATLDENNKQYDSAIINYSKAIEMLGNSSTAYEAYQGKADVYFKQKEYQKAYDTLQQTATVFATNETKATETLTKAANIAKKNLKDYSKYVQTLERELLTYPNNPSAPETMFKLGQGYEQLNKKTQAIDTYKKLIIKYPTHKLASRAQGRVNKLESKLQSL